MRCPRWLGLHVGALGGLPDLEQVPHSRGRPLVRMPLLTCLDRKLTPRWLVHPSLSTCQGMRIAAKMKCTQTTSPHIPQLVIQPLLISQLSVHQQWKTIVMYSLLILVQLQVYLPLICPILRAPHNLIRQQISVFTQQPCNSQSSIPSSSVPLSPRRSIRSTKGALPV